MVDSQKYLSHNGYKKYLHAKYWYHKNETWSVKKKRYSSISIYKIYNFVNVFFPNEESSNTTSQYRKFPPKSTLTINNLNNLTTISWSFTMLKRLSIRTFSPYPRLFHFPYSRLDKSSIRRKKGDDAITRGPGTVVAENDTEAA